MNVWEIILIGIGLSMDAVAVTLTNSMTHPNESKRKMMLMPLFFGVFQGLMPIAGFYLGSIFTSFITRYSGIVVFIILAFIGGKMLWDGIKHQKHPEECGTVQALGVKMVLVQALATSIDALAVGVGFAASGAEVFVSSLIIALTTAVLTALTLIAGKAPGRQMGCKAEILGGVILILIGAKALLF